MTRALMVLAGLATLLPAAALAQGAALHPNNKMVCDSVLAILAEGSPQERAALRAYVDHTMDEVNAINVSHGGLDIAAQLQQRPFEAIANELADECRIDISEPLFLAVARTYKSEIGAGTPRV